MMRAAPRQRRMYVLLRDENGAVASLREPSLVIRQKDEAVPSGLEFTRFLSAENP